jgi:hypothetical protein
MRNLVTPDLDLTNTGETGRMRALGKADGVACGSTKTAINAGALLAHFLLKQQARGLVVK